MSSIHRLVFAMEILLAELIFLFPSAKRSRFVLRYTAAVLLSAAVSYLFVIHSGSIPSVVLQLIRMIVVFGTTVVAMYFCFDLKFSVVVAACVAGYAVEHMTFHIVLIITSTTNIFPDISLWNLPRWELLEYIFFPLIYLFFGLTVGAFSAKYQCYRKVDSRLNSLSFAIIILTIGFTRLANVFGGSNSITLSLYAIANCSLALSVQLILFRSIDLQHENDTIKLLWKEDQRQYEITKKTIETINIKHHDLKNRLAEINMMLSEDDIQSIASAVNTYDSKIKTGNEALDVLLTKDSLLCKTEGILLTYAGNGSDFSFMSTMDVYSLFGNAVDNAIEAVRKIDDPEKRIIDIVTEKHGELVTVIVTNYYAGELKVVDGMPVTTKREDEGFHGFGMKSMSLLAQKYHGGLNVRLEEHLFILTISLFAECA